MSLLNKFREHIEQNNLFSPKDKLLLAVSGGVADVVLCELCRQAGDHFLIAHCNFQLGGEEGERDEGFVKGLGEKYKVEVKLKKFETEKYAADNKLSIQEAARELRYRWFDEFIGHQSSPATWLLTAHHADDNIETLLMNFFRGTGLHGLTGIPASAAHIRRPLLPFSKEELTAFAKENHLEFVEDSSNQSSKYTRNYFRNELIPAITKVYPQVKENLHDNISRFKEIEKLYQLSVTEIKKELCKQKGEEIHLPVKQLMGYRNRALIYEIISGYGFLEKQVDELIKLAASDSGKYITSPSGTYRIIRHRHWFIISPAASPGAENIIIEKGTRGLEFGTSKLVIDILPNSQSPIPNSSSIGCFDLGEVQFPLLLRKWKTGDYFYPLGMKKKKKLSRFFIDLKLSKTQKENAWVIESDRRIIWVVGHRIDERFKVTNRTKNMLQITLGS